ADKDAFELLKKSGLPQRVLHTIEDSGTDIAYRTRPTAEGIAMEVSFPYRDLLRRGGPIEPLSYSWVPFMPPPLSLDLRVVNNSSKTIIVNQAIFDVETSVPDREPLLLIKADPRRSRIGYFELLNEGWSTVEDPLLHVQFRPAGSAYQVRLP